MRNILFVPMLLLCVIFTAPAQVSVEIQLDEQQFLRSESVPLRVRISNFSGRTLRLGRERDWLSFNVDNREGRGLVKMGEMPPAKPLDLESSKTATLNVDLMSYFDLAEAGHYEVKVVVKIPQLEKELRSDPKAFDILSGTKLWEREFGLPSNTIPEVRKYALQQATFAKQLRLYVRLTDQTEAKVFRVLPLGMLVSFSDPETQVDNVSHLHVLFQNGARSFLYSIITPDGDQIIRQTYDYLSDSRPRLRVEEDGRIVVFGGQRRILLSDLPPPRVALTNEKSGAR